MPVEAIKQYIQDNRQPLVIGAVAGFVVCRLFFSR